MTDGRTKQQRDAEAWLDEANAQARIAEAQVTHADEQSQAGLWESSSGRRIDQLAKMAEVAYSRACAAATEVERLTADPDGSIVWAPAIRRRAQHAAQRARRASEQAQRWQHAAEARESEWEAVRASRRAWFALNERDGERMRQATSDADAAVTRMVAHVTDALDGTTNSPLVRYLGLVRHRAEAAQRSTHEAGRRMGVLAAEEAAQDAPLVFDEGELDTIQRALQDSLQHALDVTDDVARDSGWGSQAHVNLEDHKAGLVLLLTKLKPTSGIGS